MSVHHVDGKRSFVLQVSILVDHRMLHDVRCQFFLLCILPEAVVQLGTNGQFQTTLLLDVVNLIELALSSVTADKVIFVIFVNIWYSLEAQLIFVSSIHKSSSSSRSQLGRRVAPPWPHRMACVSRGWQEQIRCRCRVGLSSACEDDKDDVSSPYQV